MSIKVQRDSKPAVPVERRAENLILPQHALLSKIIR